jgi:hypothetical protein
MRIDIINWTEQRLPYPEAAVFIRMTAAFAAGFAEVAMQKVPAIGFSGYRFASADNDIVRIETYFTF